MTAPVLVSMAGGRRDPRKDPQAGDVLWSRGTSVTVCRVESDYVLGFAVGTGLLPVLGPVSMTVEEWRKSERRATVIRVS